MEKALRNLGQNKFVLFRLDWILRLRPLALPPAEVHGCLDRSEGARQVPASAPRPQTLLLELSWRGRMYFSTEKYEVQFVLQNFVGKRCGI